MLPKKYHAIAFLSILVMLLLLGLHLLGFSFLGGGSSSSANAVALARNSTGSSSSSPTGASSTLNPNAVYRHPIIYDKLTGATNNQINDVLGSGSKQDQFPLDHYQQQQQHQPQNQQQQLNRNQNPFEPFGGPEIGGDPFANHLAQTGRPFGPLGPPPPPLGVPLSRHHSHHPPPPPPLPPPPPVHMMTTQSPQQQPQQQQQQQPVNTEQRSQQQDSIPSASSVDSNLGPTRPQNASQSSAPPPQLAHYYQQQQQPVYYTPPIFTYGNFDQQQAQLPPMGVPEVPLSVDEFNVRQNRLRQLNSPTSNDNDKQQVNLLADPQAQQRHKQQMLDRHSLFGLPAANNQQPPLAYLQPTTRPVDNFTTAAYYPDPALYARLQQQQVPPASGSIRPPYAHQMAPPVFTQSMPTQLEPPTQLQQMKQPSAQNRLMASNQRLPSADRQSQARPQQHHHQQQQQQQPLVASSVVRSGQQAPQAGSSTASRSSQLQEPTCARQLQSPILNLELANVSSQLPPLICNEDSEYPTPDIMRALEQYASERSIEQLIPQQLVQMLTQSRTNPDIQRQISLDPLQASISALPTTADSSSQQQASVGTFPSANYDSLCRSTSWLAQPRRAKNLAGQWKVVVNLPGHKYRGIAISQMVRLEECVRPNGECAIGPSSSPPPPPPSTTTATTTSALVQRQQVVSMPPRSRCLQNYGNQRLLAWSHQQGLHFDLFRLPIACSCHIRRF